VAPADASGQEQLAETPDRYGAFPRLSDAQIETLTRHGEGQRVEPGEVLVVPVERLRALVTQDTVLGDLVLRAYLLRREMLIGLGAGFQIVGSRFSPDSRSLREFAARNRLPHRWIDLEEDEAAEALLNGLGVAPAETPVAVVGGGNSAGQATLFLAQHTSKVTLLIRHEDLGRDMSRYLADRIERSPKVEVLRTTEVRERVGDRALEALIVENNQTGSRRRIEARELFVYIGAKPHTGWLGEKLALDDRGFVLTVRAALPAGNGEGQDAGHEPYLLETSLPGVFAAGDVTSGSIKRVASAVGEGAMAIRLVHARLQDYRHPGHTSEGG
jgi:Pyridine nucleotide-disulphide oxidoreductase